MKANLGCAQLQPLDGPPGFLFIFTSSENLQKEEKAFWRITMATPEDDDLIYTQYIKVLMALVACNWNQDGPLNMEALNMLHADAVKFGAGAKVRINFKLGPK